MKTVFLFLAAAFAFSFADAQEMDVIKLLSPDKTRGKNVMAAFAERKSTRAFADTPLTPQDMSDLLWAANGVNRPDGKRTAPSAMNRQDVTLYACFADGAYRYEPVTHTLVPVSGEDIRPMKAPVCLILVVENPDNMGFIDVGIVSQNVSVFCAGMELATVPRASMDKPALIKALQLNGKQEPVLNHPVGYFLK